MVPIYFFINEPKPPYSTCILNFDIITGRITTNAMPYDDSYGFRCSICDTTHDYETETKCIIMCY